MAVSDSMVSNGHRDVMLGHLVRDFSGRFHHRFHHGMIHYRVGRGEDERGGSDRESGVVVTTRVVTTEDVLWVCLGRDQGGDGC